MISTGNVIASAAASSSHNSFNAGASFNASQKIASVSNKEVTLPCSNLAECGSNKLDREIKVPEIAHFIWESKGVPESHLSNILNFKKLNPEFEVKIWTTCPGSIMHTLEQMLHSNDAKYRYLAFNFSDRKEGVRFLKTEDPRSLFSDFPQGVYAAWAREHFGCFANPAAASDVLRLVALYHFGGTYFDVDVSMTEKFKCPTYNPLKKKTCGILTYGNPVITAIKNSPSIAATLMEIAKNYASVPRKTSDDFYLSRDMFSEHNGRFTTEDLWDIKRTTKRGRIYGSVQLTGIDIFKGGWWPEADPFDCDKKFGHNQRCDTIPTNAFLFKHYKIVKNEKCYPETASKEIEAYLFPSDNPLTRDWRKSVDGKAESYKLVSKLKCRRTSL